MLELFWPMKYEDFPTNSSYEWMQNHDPLYSVV